jgi:UDP-N-acetyl-D-mannosaminuronic acid dehydrogenase
LSPVLHIKPEEVDTPERRGKYTITIVGCGQKAVVHALAFADAGFKTVCADENQSGIKRLSKGNVPLGNRQLESKLKSFIRKEQINATSDLKGAVSKADVIVITADAKINEKRNSDSSEIEGVCKQVGAALQKGSLVFYRGIAGIGSLETIIKEGIENASGLKVGEDFGLAYAPEFALAGCSETQVRDEELIVAAQDKFSLNSAALILQHITKRNVKKISNVRAIESAVLFSSVMQDVNEALANELAVFCESAKLDYAETAKLLKNSILEDNVEPTISEETSRNETYLLLENAENLNVKLRLPAVARQINEDMARHAANLVQDALRDCGKTLRRAKVALLGAGETGNSAAFEELLKSKGAKTTRYDPACSGTEQTEESSLKKTLNETVEGTDCVVIISPLDQLKRLNLKKLRALMKSPAALVDLSGITDPEKIANDGFIYRGLGRGAWKK